MTTADKLPPTAQMRIDALRDDLERVPATPLIRQIVEKEILRLQTPLTVVRPEAALGEAVASLAQANARIAELEDAIVRSAARQIELETTVRVLSALAGKQP